MTHTPTPGPWKASSLMVVAPDGSQICHTGGTRYKGQTPQPYEAAANAALIAAAPDLLKACEAFVSSLVKTKEIVEQARAAIEKATSHE